MNTIFKNKISIAIGIIWLFHLSALIGSALGYLNWFASKTPLNLIIQNLLLIALYPILKKKAIALYALFFIMGMSIEILGVNSGFPFGTYSYGQNLGIKLFGVPILIGFNWALLVFITARIVGVGLIQSKPFKAFLGAGLMLLLDYFMEYTAPFLDFWEFVPINPPIENYIAWFITAFIMHLVYQSFKIEGNRLLSGQIYIAQLAFFIALIFIV